jgi:hypothetical protein
MKASNEERKNCQAKRKHIFFKEMANFHATKNENFAMKKNTIIKMKKQKVFIKIQSEMLRNDNETKSFFFSSLDDFAKETQLENGISRFISQFNVSIQNKDDRRKKKLKAEERKTFHVSFPYALLNFEPSPS